MENASKALIMAAGTLIGIMILSIASYLFITFGAETKKFQDRIDEKQLTQFNAQYNMYEGQKELTIHDVVSLVNLAQENNEYYKYYSEFDSKYEIKILLDGSNIARKTEKEKQELLKTYGGVDETTGELKNYFECSEVAYYYDNGGRVSEVKFINRPKN